MSYPGAKRFVVLDPEGKFDNLVVWDEASPWTPPEGYSLVAEDSPEGVAATDIHNTELIARNEELRKQLQAS